MNDLPVQQRSRTLFSYFQVFTVYALTERALWSSATSVRNHWAGITLIAVAAFLLVDRPSLQRLGLGRPNANAARLVLTLSLLAAALLILLVLALGGEIRAHAALLNLSRSGGYVIWAALQEFLLQSFFFTRFESLFGGSTAVWVAATLFAGAHLPNAFLTAFSLVGGLFFCEMFRRYRSLYPLMVGHALLGLTVAMTMPDVLMHHMRVGIGYLRY